MGQKKEELYCCLPDELVCGRAERGTSGNNLDETATGDVPDVFEQETVEEWSPVAPALPESTVRHGVAKQLGNKSATGVYLGQDPLVHSVQDHRDARHESRPENGQVTL